jgi:hypothetical protein
MPHQNLLIFLIISLDKKKPLAIQCDSAPKACGTALSDLIVQMHNTCYNIPVLKKNHSFPQKTAQLLLLE